MKITSLNTQQKNNLNFVNFTDGKILFSIFFKPLINFQEIKLLLEKEKRKLIHFSTVPSAQPAKRPGPTSIRAHCPHPGRNLCLGQQSRAALSPA